MAEVKKPKQLQLQLLLEPDVINGFSYSFCKALLEKLKTLSAEGQINREGKYPRNTLIYSVTTHLAIQMHFSEYPAYTGKEIENLITLAEKFLAIFEKKESGA